MRKYFYLIAIFSLIAQYWAINSVLAQEAIATSSITSSSTVVTRDDLAAQIQEKAKQLDDIDKQLAASKASLQDVKKQRVTLQGQLNNLQNNISHLNLSIQSDQINVEKLNLEIESLGYNIGDIESSITDKKSAIEKLLLELQKNDRLNSDFFVLFLRSDSLADSVMEAQNLSNLQNQLTNDITNLGNLHDEYNNTIAEAKTKKDSIAFHQQSEQNKRLIIQDQKNEQQILLVQTKNKESVYQQQVSDLEKLQQQVADEVETLDAVLRTKIDPSTLPPLGQGVLEIPVYNDTLSNITQGYGSTAFAETGYKSHWHNGVDFAASIGTPILAAEDGQILATGNQDAYCPHGAYGKFIAIKNTDNLVTLYAHLSRQIVSKGDAVKRGQVIGYSGNTGYVTGPHLHFGVYAAPTFYMGPSKVCGPMPFGGDLNPIGYL
ncbi:MAG: peptidoglycan DD-metalloendopeptidase family protein [Patescibacteria group bacterium]|nr:peptidoglycan DD-metalloendopeptidase family protein [Patescibacteria group bacterium]MDE2015717.1 peptidoglycan DD-metalloendopeptidase family protein [Patescibacteria group bacterium]MDE2226775.1 peptidoglycan DD-metalloendopeptidase family protein [Patescibacteria group bacterium]